MWGNRLLRPSSQHHTVSHLTDRLSGPHRGASAHQRRVRVPSGHAQSPRRGDQPVPAPARQQPGRLVPVGSRRARPGEAPRPADLPEHRLRGLPLVPRHGTRVVRARADRALPERPVRRDQGRSRGASRPRPGLHGRGPGDDRRRRLADVRLPDARRAAVLRRHLLPGRAAPRHAVVPPGPRGGRPGVARAARRGRGRRRPARRRGWSTRAGSRRAATTRPRRCSTRRRRRSRPRSTGRTAAGAARRSSRSR